jgi:hypothetical protein
VDDKKIMQKTQDELTVGDAVKVQVAFTAAFVAVGALIAATPVAIDSIRAWKYNRTMKKYEEAVEDLTTG